MNQVSHHIAALPKLKANDKRVADLCMMTDRSDGIHTALKCATEHTPYVDDRSLHWQTIQTP